MKKRFLIFCFLGLLLCFTACADSSVSTSSQASSLSSAIANLDSFEVIQQEEYYQVLRNDSMDQAYQVFDQDGNVVLEESVTFHPLTVEMKEEDVVGVYVGCGTGCSRHQYYSLTRNCLSQPFYDEVCFDREMIAYLALRDRETDYPHMVLVVQNAFDPEQYYREFALEIDPSLVPSAPVREAKFSADHTQLSFVYYASVEDFAEDRKTPMTVEL